MDEAGYSCKWALHLSQTFRCKSMTTKFLSWVGFIFLRGGICDKLEGEQPEEPEKGSDWRG